MNTSAVTALLDQHAEHACAVMEAYQTHTVRMVRVLHALVYQNSALTTALLELTKAPSWELLRMAAQANLAQSTKIDELLEAYGDYSKDAVATIELVREALAIVEVAANG